MSILAQPRGKSVPTSTKPPSAHVSDQATAAIPTSIRAKIRWHCWQYLPSKDGGKQAKAPIDLSGKATNGHAAAILRPFDKVRSRARKIGDGIGYRLDIDEVGIDLDDCFDHMGDLKPRFKSIVDTLNSYTGGLTPSGNGLHIIVLGKKPSKKCRVAGVEVYDHASNFLTVTGNHLDGTPTTVEPRQEALDDLFATALEEIPTGLGGG